MAHGGDIYKQHIDLDFSVSINPLGPNLLVEQALTKSIHLVNCYPDYENEQLRSMLTNRYGCTNVILGNGASELILAVFHGLMPKKVLVPVPSFTGYEYGANAAEAMFVPVCLNEDYQITEELLRQIPECDLLILTNPNNPTGRLLPPEVLRAILVECERCGTALLVDECFIELSDHPEYSVMSLIDQYECLMVLNAFTKSYCIPGIRFGFMTAGEKLFQRIRKHLAEWNISVPAACAAGAAVRELQYLESARNIIYEEREYLTEELQELGMKVIPSECNFILFKTEPSKDLYTHCLMHNILIRDCSDFRGLGKGYYRVCVRNHEENQRLIHVLKEFR